MLWVMKERVAVHLSPAGNLLPTLVQRMAVRAHRPGRVMEPATSLASLNHQPAVARREPVPLIVCRQNRRRPRRSFLIHVRHSDQYAKQ
jgi:hypothetical protein